MFNVKKLKKGFFVSVNVLLITCLSSCAVGELIVGKIGRTVKFWKRGNEVDHKTRLANIGSDLAQIRGRQESFIRPLSLADTIEYVMHHNVDVMIDYQNELIKQETRDGANLKMLPGIIFDLERSKRDRHDTSKSKTKNAGEKSLDPSYSEDKNKFTISTKFAWDLVDFGISYFRSRQAKNETKIARERRRRTMQNLCLRTIESYWDVQTSRETMILAEGILKKAIAAQKTIQENLKEKVISRQSALEDEVKLIEMEMKLGSYRKEYIANKAQLAALMGLAPGTDFALQKEDFGRGFVKKIHVDFKSLEARAFRNRPELFEHDSQEKIAEDEARIALASMFPSLALFTRHDRDSNPFLYAHNWYTVGLNSTLDLLSLPQKYSKRKIAFMQKDLAKQKRLALVIGIVAQIRLAELEFSEAISDYNNSRKIYEKRVAILEEMRKAEEEGAERGNNILFAENTALGSQLKMLESYSALQTARERLRNSVGEGPNENQNDWSAVGPNKFEPFKIPTISSEEKVSLEINRELALSGTPAHAEIKETRSADSGAGAISPALNIRKTTNRKSIKGIKSRNLKLPEKIEKELNKASWKVELDGTAANKEKAEQKESITTKNPKAALSKKAKSLITKDKQQFSLPTFTSSKGSRKSEKPVVISDIDGSSEILQETEKNLDQNPINAAETIMQNTAEETSIAAKAEKPALITEKAHNAVKLPAPQADAIPEKDIQPEQIKEEIIVKPAFAKIEPDKSSATVT
ncbi:MAG: TolC family protein, partial [Planctomycetota bacterium]